MSIHATLTRQHLSIARASEYFSSSELQAQTGQPAERFCSVALKELIDNALDASETAGRRPEIIVTTNRTGDRLRLSVEDNGDGLPADVIKRILNFETRTSDKAAYRAPTRGAQGNALKTIFGIPVALGDVRSRLVIESQGQRHHVEVWSTPGGAVRHEIDSEPSTRTEGTRVCIDLPLEHEREWNPPAWVRDFARLNPHAQIQIRENASPIQQAKPGFQFFGICLCEPSAAADWRKFSPGDLTAPHWYTPADFARLVHLKADHDPEQRITDFAREFRGQSRRYKAVCKDLTAKTVGDLAGDTDQIRRLHAALKDAPAPSPDVLGRIGEAHLMASFEPFHPLPDRSWYRVKTGEVDGIPFTFEIAIAETKKPGGLFYGLNFSAPFGDPLSGSYLFVNDETAYGLSGILANIGAFNGTRYGMSRNVAVAAHLIMPVMPTLDRGKSRLALPRATLSKIGDTIGKAASVLHKEIKAHLRNQSRREPEPEKAASTELSKKDAVLSILLDTYLNATENEALYITARDFFYAIRPGYNRLEVRASKTGADLDFGYFSQTIMPTFRREVHPMTMVDYKARGTLYNPHDDTETPIGDKELREWTFPAWTFNKILFIEKEGVWQTLKQVGGRDFAKRWDLAILYSEGFSTEAVRKLLALAQQTEGYQLFVWHDADPSGYNIARTLAEETERMPEHCIKVYDLGVFLEDAIAAGYQSETFTRKTALPSTLTLTDFEREQFTGRRVSTGYDKGEWVDCVRVEINAIPIRERIPYLEAQLAKIPDLLPKVIPPPDVLIATAERRLSSRIEMTIADAVKHRINLDTIIDRAVLEVRTGRPSRLRGQRMDAAIRSTFADKKPRKNETDDQRKQADDRRKARGWSEVLDARVQRHLTSAALTDEIARAVQTAVEREIRFLGKAIQEVAR